MNEVVSQNPFRNVDKWPSVMTNVNVTLQLTRPNLPDIAEWMMRERLNTLLKHHAEENAAALKKQVCVFVCVMCALLHGAIICCMFLWCRSGTDEEYKEKKKLLQDISDLKRDGDKHR